jgi:hypothetical protein
MKDTYTVLRPLKYDLFVTFLIFRNEFTELERYLTKEYEDLKSLWLEFSEQHAKAKSEEEVLIQMLRELKSTSIEESQSSCLNEHTDNLMQVCY